MELKLELLTDSTANLGMHNCIGSGRVRHVDVKWLRPDTRSRASLEVLIEEGQYRQQRERSDHETPQRRKT